MKDGIIKANGTSRLVRGNFPSTYEEFRARAAAGTLPLDVLFNETGWSQQPTFLNKGNLLKDATAAMFGLTETAVPDDALAFLGKFNWHWWRVRQNGSAWVAVQGDAARVTVCSAESPSMVKIRFSNRIDISNTGVISLVNPVETTAYGDYSKLDNYKYFETTVYSGSGYDGKVYYVPDGTAAATAGWTNDVYMVYKTACLLSTAYTESLGDWSLQYSQNRTAYPDSGIKDGYEYEYLGVPFENMTKAPAISAGSYAGTGTGGVSNKNSLTFDFSPKLIVISTESASYWTHLIMVRGTTKQYYNTNKHITVTWGENTVSWYGDGAAEQGNYSGYTYRYVAIG